MRLQLMRHPLGGRSSSRIGVAIVGALVACCCVTRDSARIRVTDLHATAMPGVEVRTGTFSAFTNQDGVATFHDLPLGQHEFDARFRGFRSCGPAVLEVDGGVSPSATITLRLIPGQGWIDMEGKAVTPTAADLQAEANEEALPCPEAK